MMWFRRRQSTTASATDSTAVAQLETRPDEIDGPPRSFALPYLLPTDFREIERLNTQHAVLRNALGADFLAPVSAPTSILDVGSGTDIWARSVAARYPSAAVAAFDIRPARDAETAPENCVHIQGDVLDGLPFADGAFNLTHARFLAKAIPAPRWPDVLGEIVRVTARGGWIELVEATIPREGGPALEQLVRWGAELASRAGIDLRTGELLSEKLRAAGIDRVTVRELALPVGGRKKAGKQLLANELAMIEGMRGPLLAHGIAPADEYDATVTRAAQELRRGSCVQPFSIAYGQRT